MPAIITDKFRIHNSEQFQEAFSEGSGNVMYLGIGRPQAFATSTRGDGRTNNEGTDTAPLTPGDNRNAQSFPFDDLLAAKRIAASDVTFAVPRRNWVTGTTYDIYRHDYGDRITGTSTAQTSNSGVSTLHDANFYVLTTARNVYKCLDNDGNTASTVEPTGTATTVLATADGYKWKFLGKVTESARKFLTDEYIPIEFVTNALEDENSTQLLSQQQAINGSIDRVVINSNPGVYSLSSAPTESTSVQGKVLGSSGVTSGTHTFAGLTVGFLYSDVPDREAIDESGIVGYRIYTNDGAGDDIGQIRTIDQLISPANQYDGTEDGGETGLAQSEESGAYYAQYAIGNFKVGYGKSLYAPALTAKNGAKTSYH